MLMGKHSFSVFMRSVFVACVLCIYAVFLLHCLAQDNGGPSKGGFLNSIYLCNEINDTCVYTKCYSGKSSIIQETTFIRTTFVLARIVIIYQTNNVGPRGGHLLGVCADLKPTKSEPPTPTRAPDNSPV